MQCTLYPQTVREWPQMILHYKVGFEFADDDSGYVWEVKAVVAIDEKADAAWIVDCDISDEPKPHILDRIDEEAIERAWRIHEQKETV